MDCSRLDGAYRALLHAARSVLAGGSGCDPHGAMCWTLCHIALYDQILVAAAREIACGETSVVVESGPEMCPDVIGAVIAQRTPKDLVDLVDCTALNLLSALESIPDERADTAVRVRLATRTGAYAFDDWLSWRDLIAERANEQLPRHARFISLLAELAGAEEADRPTNCRAGHAHAQVRFLEPCPHGSDDDDA
ncbi:hypothetical protein [Streptomyces sp. NPDC048282]|uniref:hypothetical protein n=1 Tax=Streptomyces sp. NPDC048282 TaxID=3365528 RepID=UPI00371E0240